MTAGSLAYFHFLLRSCGTMTMTRMVFLRPVGVHFWSLYWRRSRGCSIGKKPYRTPSGSTVAPKYFCVIPFEGNTIPAWIRFTVIVFSGLKSVTQSCTTHTEDIGIWWQFLKVCVKAAVKKVVIILPVKRSPSNVLLYFTHYSLLQQDGSCVLRLNTIFQQSDVLFSVWSHHQDRGGRTTPLR